MKTLIFILLFFSLNILYSQFKVVQNRPNNYSFNYSENAHQLTDGSSSIQATAIWNDNSVKGYENINLNENFLVEAEYYLGFKDKEGADGIAFVLQTDGDGALGSVGVGMGFAMNRYDNNKAVIPSLGIELDTWYNSPQSPPNVDYNKEDHFAYIVNADLMDRVGTDINVKVDQNNSPLNIEDSTFHCVKFLWNANKKELTSYCDGQMRKSELFDGINVETIDKIISGTSAYWGFTTGTATRDNIHMVRFDKISRGNSACFATIYKNSPYDTTNQNCGFNEINTCIGSEQKSIILSLSTANLEISNIIWKSKNGKSTITPLNQIKDKVEVFYKENDEIDVTVNYQNGCSSGDSFIIETESFSIINDYDTIYTCSNEFIPIDLDLLYNGSRVDNSVKVDWSWDNGKYIQDPSQYSDKELINTKDKDTINFTIKASLTDDLGNVCTDETMITVISEKYYSKEEIVYSPCIDTATIDIQLYYDKDMNQLLNNNDIKEIKWIPPSSINDFVGNKFPVGLKASVVNNGTYVVRIEMNSGCTFQVTLVIDFNIEQLDILPNKIELCENDSIDVESSIEALTYLWSTGDTTKSIVVVSPGTYKLELITNNGCTFVDSVIVNVLPSLKVNITGDTTVCELGEFVELKVNENFDSYLWSNGKKSNSIKVNNPGKYWVKVRNKFGCFATDTINVISFDSLFVNIYEEDNEDCSQDSVVIFFNTNSQNPDFTWSTGDKNRKIVVRENGIYWIELTDDISGCILRDTIEIELTKNFEPKLEGELEMCSGKSTILKVTGCEDCNYLWSDGSTENYKEIDSSAEGYVLVSKNGCSDSLSFAVKINDKIQPFIKGNLKVCNSDFTSLYIEGEYDSILWSNNEESKSIQVKESGEYSVIVTKNGCMGFDTVNVELINVEDLISYDKFIDFGKIYLDSVVKININISNTNNDILGIDLIFNDIILSKDINNNEEFEFEINPKSLGAYNNKILLIVNYPCLDTFEIDVVGEIYTKVQLTLPQLSYYPGDSLSVPITLTGRLDTLSEYKYTMNFDKHILVLEDKESNISFSGTINPANERIILNNPKGLALLTSLTRKPLIVDTVLWTNKYIETEIINGWIELIPVCNHENIVIFSNSTDIDTYIDENEVIRFEKSGELINSEFKIEIYNLAGKLVLSTKININNQDNFNIGMLDSGVYFIYITNSTQENVYQFIKTE